MNRLAAWFDRLMKADERYVCGVCDDRFFDRTEGTDHILRCHPEFRTVMVYEGQPDASPARQCTESQQPVGLPQPALG